MPDARLLAARPTHPRFVAHSTSSFFFRLLYHTKHKGKQDDPDAEIRTGFTSHGSLCFSRRMQLTNFAQMFDSTYLGGCV